MLVSEYKVWSRLLSEKVFLGHRVEFWQIKNIFIENDSSFITDSCLGYDRPQTAHTAAKTTKVKDLALILRSVSLTQ